VFLPRRVEADIGEIIQRVANHVVVVGFEKKA
jgi:hypothetical protein